MLKRLILGKFTFTRLIRSTILIYLIFAAYVFFNADRMIFLPPPPSYQAGSEILQLPVMGSGDALHSGFSHRIAALHLSSPGTTYTLLYSHGNAEDLGQIRPVLELLRSGGLNVFAYDYRGYGLSTGTAGEQASYQDIETAYQYVTTKLGVAPEQVIALGRSVGSGPTVDLAARHRLGGMILENAFTSAFRVVLPFPLLPFDKFTNLAKIPQVRCPVFIIHAALDSTIPIWHGEALFEAANEPKQFWRVEGAEHNDLVQVAGREYLQRILSFLRDVEQ